MTLTEWATRWALPAQALQELAGMGHVPDPPKKPEGSESYVQSAVRLEAAYKGIRLWRNNVGAGTIVHSRIIRSLCPECRELVPTRPIRWGLANDSTNLNDELKSSDLVGWRSRLITSEMVGTKMAQPVLRECKEVGWALSPDDPHEQAQMRWHLMALADGCDSAIVSGTGSL